MLFKTSTCTLRPIKRYRLRKDLPRQFYPEAMGKFTQKNLRAGEVCEYFEHNDVYCFDARDKFVPSISRKVVEAWDKYFEPVKERDAN